MSAPVAETTNGATMEVDKEQEGFRVYIGNLPFSVTEEQVREFVAKSGGEVLAVILPMRHGRPSGFAFVQFKTEEAAKNAVEKLDESAFGERKVQLQFGRSKEEQAERREAAIAKREAAKAARGEAGETEAPADGEVKKRRNSRKREPRRRLPAEGEEATEADGQVAEGTEKPKRKPRARKPREARIDGEGEQEEVQPTEAKPKRERKPKLELTGEQSENTIFVANLPFSVDDSALAAIFTNLSIRVKTATVVKGVRRGRGGRPFRASRGFGFVEVEDASQQQDAVEKVAGSLVGDRKITAKVANEMKPIEAEELAEAKQESAA